MLEIQTQGSTLVQRALHPERHLPSHWVILLFFIFQRISCLEFGIWIQDFPNKIFLPKQSDLEGKSKRWGHSAGGNVVFAPRNLRNLGVREYVNIS